MKDDLISRQAAIDALMSLTVYKSKREIVQAVDKNENSWIGGVAECIDEIEDLPSAQPQHMKGKWIHDGYDFPHGNDWIHCSICGKKGINVPADLTNFCPNCGADMRGEELDETD